MKAAKVRYKSFNKLQDSAEIGNSPIGCHQKQQKRRNYLQDASSSWSSINYKQRLIGISKHIVDLYSIQINVETTVSFYGVIWGEYLVTTSFGQNLMNSFSLCQLLKIPVFCCLWPGMYNLQPISHGLLCFVFQILEYFGSKEWTTQCILNFRPLWLELQEVGKQPKDKSMHPKLNRYKKKPIKLILERKQFIWF